MSKRRSMFQRNFFRRPSVRALVPDLKLLLAVLTVSCESNVGTWIPGGLAEDAGLDPTALAGGIADLERRGLILSDKSTGEVFLSDFFRDNTFCTSARRGAARDDFNLIMSPRLRRAVVEAVELAGPEVGLRPTDLHQPVDNSGDIVKNQIGTEQGKEREGKERKKRREELSCALFQ